ncbi:hypothetical protein ACEWY4_020825 [Coilia grayii]|uniref:Uncharacterized protein n=1 Tax=Coilia grayii TaxID=363190 RepID=A0ABD1J7C8_9TELE
MDIKHTGILLWIHMCFSLFGFSVLCSRELPHVSRYDVVRLQRLGVNGRTRRSASFQQTFPDELHFRVALEGTNYTLHLEKNRGLIGKDYTLTHYQEDGTLSTTGPEATDHCYYHGHIPGLKNSSISVGLCSGMHGVVSVEQQVYLMEPLEGSVEGDHAVYRPEHLRRGRGKGRERRGTPEHHDVDILYDNTPRPLGMRSHASLSAPRFVELVVVVDSSEYKHYKNKKKLEEFILGVVNHVDKLYKLSFNLRVILVGLEVWSVDQIPITSDPSSLLYSFIDWRNKKLITRKKHDNAQFVTAVDFTGSTVGLGFLSVMCFENSGAVNQDRHDGIESLASTMAHEMGHNLGMSHDEEHCNCGNNRDSCVMAESVSNDNYPQYFSGCSQTHYRKFLTDYNPMCLLNRPTPEQAYGPPRCGNGLLERGEQCDCGTVQECTNPCCNATTCRLTEGSQCAEGECCQSCKFKSSRSMCRASAHDCDLAEHCTGSSAECPRDVYRMNGSPCDRNHGYCYNGQCPSRRQQCQVIFGKDADACSEKTCTGRWGCDEQQKTCGNVQCRGGQTRYNISYLFVGRRTDCKEVTDIKNSPSDLKRAPTGTKCGKDMVCVKGLCQDTSVYGTKDCADKCNNRGVCNHENECHCDPGWAPPYCTEELPNQETGSSSVVVGVCVAVGVLLLLTLVMAALSCCRNTHSKPPTATKGRSGFRQARTSSGQSNPVFQAGSAKNSPHCGPPQISSPTFLESTATQSCQPLPATTTVPSRSAPQPPQKPPAPAYPMMQQAPPPQNSNGKPAKSPPVVPPVKPQLPANKPSSSASKPLPVASHPLPVVIRPQAPSRPLPPLTPKTANKPLVPPMPPAKPTASPPPWKSEVSAGQKIALIPPRGGR